MVASCAFSACGSPASRGAGAPAPSAENPDQAVSDGGAASTAPATRTGAELRRPEEGLRDVRPIRWDRAKGKGRRVTLFYYSGVKECHGLDRVDVDESPDEVVVTVFEGIRPGAQACIELAVEVKTVIELRRPLGGRRLVDGS